MHFTLRYLWVVLKQKNAAGDPAAFQQSIIK